MSEGFESGLTLARSVLGLLIAPSLLGILGLRGATLYGAACAGGGATGLILLRQPELEGAGVIGRLLAGERELETDAADR